MKRKITTILVLITIIAALTLPILLTGCTPRENVLKVYNWSEYIGEDVISQFEEYYYEITGQKIKVKYDMFDENELMYAQIKTTQADYDVICPSDYMVEKLIKENLLLKLAPDLNELGNFDEEIEDYRDGISDLFKSGEDSYFKFDYDEESGEYNLYSRTYMTGTMGILYAVDSDLYENSSYGEYSSMQEYVEANGWAVLWDKAFDQNIMMKNSLRDSYAIGAIYTLLNERSKYYNPSLTPAQAQNATDDETVKKIEEYLINQKPIISGYENDEGKELIIEGDIDLTLQWAGDAVYAMDSLQEELGITRELAYFVPYEGSNLFSDAWCIPKYAGNVTAANLWINFMCRPDIAIENMDYIGYTSGVATEEIYEYILDNWASDDEENAIKADLTHFFGESCEFADETGKVIVYIDEDDYNAFEAQFFSSEVLERCAVMRDFGDRTSVMNRMWRNVKS
ncbi:MAG: extracellular solute-binding protein [Clostridia bacterium]|nr:extracellular solute-binding protein [Clostridia bacterium]MDE7328238.1 extracellular solute-binding protein [Clostridia bacterium]